MSYGYSPYDYTQNYSNYYLTSPSNTARKRRVFGAFTDDNPFSQYLKSIPLIIAFE